MTLVVSAISLKLVDNGKADLALKVNSRGSGIAVAGYVAANLVFIGLALN